MILIIVIPKLLSSKPPAPSPVRQHTHSPREGPPNKKPPSSLPARERRLEASAASPESLTRGNRGNPL